MTNYSTFPSWRAYMGLTIKFSNTSYSWSDDTRAQRRYLLTSNYLSGAEGVYIGWCKKWFTVSEFRDFITRDTYEQEKTAAIKAYKESKNKQEN